MWRILARRSHKKKITRYIDLIGGELIYIRPLDYRRFIYLVDYTKDGVKLSKTVVFDIVNDEVWY